MIKNIALCSLVLMAAACSNEAQPLKDVNDDSSGGSAGIDGDGHDGDMCPFDGGTACSGEGTRCDGLVCHCGTWISQDNPACGISCTQPPPNPSSCETGMACSGEGVVCKNGNVCHCGRWYPKSLADTACPGTDDDPTCDDVTCPNGTHCEDASGHLSCEPDGAGGAGGSAGASGSGGSAGDQGISCDTVTCPAGTHCEETSGHLACEPDGTGGAGGSSGTGGTGGSGGSPVGTRSVTIEVLTGYLVDHIWCEGAEVEQFDHDSDLQTQFYEAWYSFGCDSFDGGYSCTVQVPGDRALRFQCYLKTPGTSQSGDLVRYTCASPAQLQSGETFDVSAPYVLVTNLDPDKPGKNCQVD